MQNYRKRVLTSLLLTVLIVVFFKTPGMARDCAAWNQIDPLVMAADIAFARPLGAVATVVGFTIFVVSAPFSALGGNSQEAWNSLVASPAGYTFTRPLGHFDCE